MSIGYLMKNIQFILYETKWFALSCVLDKYVGGSLIPAGVLSAKPPVFGCPRGGSGGHGDGKGVQFVAGQPVGEAVFD